MPVSILAKNTSGNRKPVVAQIGERTITRQAVDYHVRQITQKRRQKPTEAETAALVDRMVEQTLFAEEARALGLDKEPEVQLLLQETVDKLLAHLYIYRHLLPKVLVSESEIAAYYQQHKSKWQQPETIRARHILLRVANEASAAEVQAVEAKALRLWQRLDAGEDFVLLAKQYSEDTGTKDKGGELGFFSRRGKVAAMAETAFALQDGEISKPVRTSVGYHILQTLERRPSGIKELKDVRGDIRARILREKRQEAARKERKLLEKKYMLLYSEPQPHNQEEATGATIP